MASSGNTKDRVSWIRYANKICYCHNVAAIKVSMTSENPNRLFYRCKHKPDKRCGFFRWCEPIGCETESTQTVESNMMDCGYNGAIVEDELEVVLFEQAMKFDALKKEFEGKLVEMKKIMEQEIQVLKKESEMEISTMNKLLEAQVQVVQSENKELMLEVKMNMEKDIDDLKKISIEEMVAVKRSNFDEVSFMREELGRTKNSFWKLKVIVLIMMFMLGWLCWDRT